MSRGRKRLSETYVNGDIAIYKDNGDYYIYERVWQTNKKRRCKVRGCSKKLSRFNPNDFCFSCIAKLSHLDEELGLVIHRHGTP